jgi:hypothetical protein
MIFLLGLVLGTLFGMLVMPLIYGAVVGFDDDE